MNPFTADPGTDPVRCDALSTQRCASCHQPHDVSELVQVAGIGQICERCDDELLAHAVDARFPNPLKESVE